MRTFITRVTVSDGMHRQRIIQAKLRALLKKISIKLLIKELGISYIKLIQLFDENIYHLILYKVQIEVGRHAVT